MYLYMCLRFLFSEFDNSIKYFRIQIFACDCDRGMYLLILQVRQVTFHPSLLHGTEVIGQVWQSVSMSWVPQTVLKQSVGLTNL